MSAEKRDPHTLYGIEGKTYTRGAWEVDIELIEEWLREVDDDTYDQIGAAIEILGEPGRDWVDRWWTRSSGPDTRT